MLFNSFTFIFVFLPIVVVGYYLLLAKKKNQLSAYWLLASSLFFYSYWKIEFLPILLSSLLFNYFVGFLLRKETVTSSHRKVLLFLGLTANILLLGYFKYSNFFIETINELVGGSLTTLSIVLPLGISFITFQKIAYLVDCYKRKTKEKGFVNYALFVTFFPQLIAGPIVHHAEIIPQFKSLQTKILNYENLAKGLFLFSIGLFKKVVLADTFAYWASNGFNQVYSLDFIESWMSVISYAFQIYFDFSGYSDMAIGAALFFNIVLPINFDSPYRSTNIQVFWRRWHITLSNFLKDYVYIPLGGNKKGLYRNLILTFLIGGIWHGAAWTFVIWGLLHGGALVVHRCFTQFKIALPKSVAWSLTFLFLCVTWVFFRAGSMEVATTMLVKMGSIHSIALDERLFVHLPSVLQSYVTPAQGFLLHLGGSKFTPLWLIMGFVIIFFPHNSQSLMRRFKCTTTYVVVTTLLFSISILHLNRISEFLYFNF